jgi:hypothetical protein
MAIAYINTTIEIPNVQSQSCPPVIITDGGYTAGVNYRRDATPSNKRQWELKCINVSSTQAYDIRSYLEGIYFTSCNFWIDELGGTSTSASIQLMWILQVKNEL